MKYKLASAIVLTKNNMSKSTLCSKSGGHLLLTSNLNEQMQMLLDYTRC